MHTAVDTVVESGVDVFAQNVETVERLTHPVRDPRASYAQTFDVLAQVISAAAETEPHPYGSEQPCLGEGLTKAVRRAVAPVGPRSKCIPWCLTDVANERHRVDEWMAALGRNHRAFVTDPVHDQPLLETGDVGAASAAMLAAIAITQWQTRCSEGDVALIATASDGPERGAMLLSVNPAG